MNPFSWSRTLEFDADAEDDAADEDEAEANGPPMVMEENSEPSLRRFVSSVRGEEEGGWLSLVGIADMAQNPIEVKGVGP